MKRRRPKPSYAVEETVYRLSRKFDYPDIDTKSFVNANQGLQWGVFVHAGAVSQEIAVDGALLEWSVLEALGAADWNVIFPTSAFEIPANGYYDIAVSLAWDTWEQGGSVSVLRSALAVWPPNADATIGRWSYSLRSRVFSGVAKAVYCSAGDTISVFVDHGDSSAHDIAAAWMAVELVDRLASIAGQNLFVFTANDTFDWSLAGEPDTLSDVWVIGGGASGSKGASSSTQKAGGGGAGGVLHLTDYAVSGDVPVVVGAGGASVTGAADDLVLGNPGADSSFDGQVADGGGFGGVGAGTQNGNNGGCGGGGGASSLLFGLGGAGSQGGDGADGTDGDASTRRGGGGGGGGGDGSIGTAGVGGDGGVGVDLTSIVGAAYGDGGWFAGGGAGNGQVSDGLGGQGGGGDGGQAALANSGGGGGSSHTVGGAGGSGIVIVKVR